MESSFPVVEELGSMRGSERGRSNFTLSWQELVREQNSDPGVRQLFQHALEESKVSTVPRCFFKARSTDEKWRPPTLQE